MKFLALVPILLAASTLASAQDCVPCEGKCLTNEQVSKLRAAVDELENIHKSPAVIEFQEPITIIRDWDGRIYISGGEERPIRLKVKIGKHIDRDMAVVLDSRVWYRPEPEPPIFRLRIRAQAGVLVPEVVKTATGEEAAFLDAGIGWDVMHFGIVNFSVLTGVRSIGAGPGVDLTKNFGLYAGYSLIYDEFQSSALAGVYFSFN